MSFLTEFNRAFGFSVVPVEKRTDIGVPDDAETLNLKKFYFSVPIKGWIWAKEMDEYGIHVSKSQWIRAGLSATGIGLLVIVPFDLFATFATQPWRDSETASPSRKYTRMIGKGHFD